MPRTQIVAALETGSMKAQGSALTHDQRLALAAHLSKITEAEVSTGGLCASGVTPAEAIGNWNGWGVDLSNTRFQPAPGLLAEDIPKLKLKWAFGFPGLRLFWDSPPSTPAAFTSVARMERSTRWTHAHGCIYWTFKAPVTVRSAISLDSRLAYFGDIKANVYAIERTTGKLVWQANVDAHPTARVTGAPALYDGRLYVPVSSVEEPPAGIRNMTAAVFAAVWSRSMRPLANKSGSLTRFPIRP